MATTVRKPTRQLLAELFGGIKDLARERVDEAKAERAVERETLRRAPIRIGVALGATFVGVLLASHALALGLAALGLPVWAGYGIIGLIALVTGIVLLRRMPNTGELDTIPEAALKRIGQDIKEIAKEIKYDVKTAVQSPPVDDSIALPPGGRR